MFQRRMAAVGLAMGATFGAPSWAAEASKSGGQGDPVTQGIMHSIFTPMSEVLPLSFDEKAFSAPANRKKISGYLKAILDNADALEKHGKGKERAFEYVAKSFKNDAKHLNRWYSKGGYDEARFTLHNMTENCVTCHMSFPESHRYPRMDSFLKAVKADAIHPLEKAHFLVMSRQFDEALTAYETFFRAADVPPSSLTTLGSFVDYLKVSANVKQDLTRPAKLLDEVLKKPDLSAAAKGQLQKWRDDLMAFDKQGVLAKNGIEQAREMLGIGRKQMEFPRDRDGLIPYLAAGSILHRYVHDHPDRGVDVAEAYYMLGITESLLGRSFWVSRSDFYLESAIRLAPAADFAPKAYALLEESYTSGFSGSSGTNVPQDVKDLLFELKKIVEQGRGGKA